MAVVRDNSLGIYISIPFCRSKCTYCNFASGVYPASEHTRYVDRLIQDIEAAGEWAGEMGVELARRVDTVYLGGGTPSLLEPKLLARLFAKLRSAFKFDRKAEITVECAPGQLADETLGALAAAGVNRVSLGVQSFIDSEAHASGRLHSRAIVAEDLRRLRAAGLGNVNVDLIAGLAGQTFDSWRESLDVLIESGVPHASVYMLEVDEDSRLGRELIAGGTRYHAHNVPDEGAIADFYQQACDTLHAAAIQQYEISNFARVGKESRHNLKYWTRQPYLGFGVDAHSMLPAEGRRPSGAEALNKNRDADGTAEAGPLPIPSGGRPEIEAVRFSTPDSLDGYMNHGTPTVTPVSKQAALEESLFLGLRLSRGVDLARIRAEFGAERVAGCESVIEKCAEDGLLEKQGAWVRLTPRGRLLSNDVFVRFLAEDREVGTSHVNPR